MLPWVLSAFLFGCAAGTGWTIPTTRRLRDRADYWRNAYAKEVGIRRLFEKARNQP